MLKIRQIAESQHIPYKYLEQIIAILKKNNLLQSLRGASGAYKLKRSPERITIYEVLQSLEGSLSVIDYGAQNLDAAEWSLEQGLFWQKLEESYQSFLNISLADFAKTDQTRQAIMYYI